MPGLYDARAAVPRVRHDVVEHPHHIGVQAQAALKPRRQSRIGLDKSLDTLRRLVGADAVLLAQRPSRLGRPACGDPVPRLAVGDDARVDQQREEPTRLLRLQAQVVREPHELLALLVLLFVGQALRVGEPLEVAVKSDGLRVGVRDAGRGG